MADKESPDIHTYDIRSGSNQPLETFRVGHAAPITLMRFNAAKETVISTDSKGACSSQWQCKVHVASACSLDRTALLCRHDRVLVVHRSQLSRFCYKLPAQAGFRLVCTGKDKRHCLFAGGLAGRLTVCSVLQRQVRLASYRHTLPTCGCSVQWG